MLCPCCSTDRRIVRTRYAVSGDASSATPTLLYNIPVFVCPDPQCACFGVEIDGEPVELPVDEMK